MGVWVYVGLGAVVVVVAVLVLVLCVCACAGAKGQPAAEALLSFLVTNLCIIRLRLARKNRIKHNTSTAESLISFCLAPPRAARATKGF